MRYNIGIYASNDWSGVKAVADQMRAERPCTVRIRDGALFTADQREDFDIVFVKGNFPAVMEAYADVRSLDEPTELDGNAGESAKAPARSKRGAKSKGSAPDSGTE
jgi:hypothetical protein